MLGAQPAKSNTAVTLSIGSTQLVVYADEKLPRFWNWNRPFTSSQWMQCRDTSPLFEFALAVSQRLILAGRTIWIADAHRDDEKRFIVRSDKLLTAFVELQRAVHAFAVSLIA